MKNTMIPHAAIESTDSLILDQLEAMADSPDAYDDVVASQVDLTVAYAHPQDVRTFEHAQRVAFELPGAK